MKGPHDLGAKPGFGLIAPEKDEPVFHGEWEKKVLALTLAAGFTGSWNIDISRHARECIGFENYRNFSYYEIWLTALENLLEARGLASREEIESGKSKEAPVKVNHVLKASEVAGKLAAGGPADREITREHGFQAGDKVKSRNIKTDGHCRLPEYAMGAEGVIRAIQGFHVFPDDSAHLDDHDRGENPQWLYSVSFPARNLFGPQADEKQTVNLDMWEPYLERI